VRGQARCDNVGMPEADDLRQFIRDIAARHERIWREQSAMLREESRMLREATNELRDTREENREEHRAQREALFQILDRLQNGGAQA
jgi:hypothetical protein